MPDYDSLELWHDGEWCNCHAEDVFCGMEHPEFNLCKFIYDSAKTSFYKIVPEKPCGSFAIKCGTIIEAKETVTRKAPLALHGPFFHFAKGAFNTLLWHDVLAWDYKSRIYKVKPLTTVVGNDCEGKAQYGAQKLMFLNKVPFNQMLKKALQELDENREQIIRMNPLCYEDKKIEAIITAWKKHKISDQVY